MINREQRGNGVGRKWLIDNKEEMVFEGNG